LLKGSSTKTTAKVLIQDLLEDAELERKPKKLEILRIIYPGLVQTFDEALASILQRGGNPSAVGNLQAIQRTI
jgi:hypothetical protein